METHSDMIVPERDSIFGDTYNGVPSPTVPHTHPYPTRFHGPIYTYPRFMKPYRQQSWQSPGDYVFPSTYVGPTNGIGASPPSNGPALFGSATGNVLLDTLLGAGLGYVAAAQEDERMLWAGAGGVAALLAGTLGLVAVAAAGLYERRR